ncbi:MAG: TraR/DksA C4-type zinc finger protein [bacterium]
MAEKTAASSKKKLFDKIKQDLSEKKRTILAGANEAISSKLGAQNENLPELGDQAMVEIDSNFLLRLKDREKRLLTKIDQALDRIEKGTFGICEECGQEIGAKRLEARPVTTMCIECKTDQEEREKLLKE